MVNDLAYLCKLQLISVLMLVPGGDKLQVLVDRGAGKGPRTSVPASASAMTTPNVYLGLAVNCV